MRAIVAVNTRSAFAHEDAAAYEDGFGSQLHYEAGVGWGGYASGAEVWDWQLPFFRYHLYQFVGRAVLFGLA